MINDLDREKLVSNTMETDMGLIRNRITKRPMGLSRYVDAQSRLHLIYLPCIDSRKMRTVSYNTVSGQIAPLNPALKEALRTAWVDVDTLARADRNDNPFVQSDLKDELHCQIMQLAGDVTADSQKFLKKAASALHVVTFKNNETGVFPTVDSFQSTFRQLGHAARDGTLDPRSRENLVHVLRQHHDFESVFGADVRDEELDVSWGPSLKFPNVGVELDVGRTRGEEVASKEQDGAALDDHERVAARDAVEREAQLHGPLAE